MAHAEPEKYEQVNHDIEELRVMAGLQWSERDNLIRLATLIDGEGHIEICGTPAKRNKFARTKMWSLVVKVSNTDPRMIQWCTENFGGKVYRIRQQEGAKAALFDWVMRNAAAAELLQRLLPFFLIKRQQAEIAIAYRQTFSVKNRHYKGLDPAISIKREEMQKQLRASRRQFTYDENAVVEASSCRGGGPDEQR